MDDPVDDILESFKKMVHNISNALRIAGVPEPLIALYTFNLPDIYKLLPEDAVDLFQTFRDAVVIYLYNSGYKKREIQRQVGSLSPYIINAIIKKYKSKHAIKNKALMDEVTN